MKKTKFTVYFKGGSTFEQEFNDFSYAMMDNTTPYNPHSMLVDEPFTLEYITKTTWTRGFEQELDYAFMTPVGVITLCVTNTPYLVKPHTSFVAHPSK